MVKKTKETGKIEVEISHCIWLRRNGISAIVFNWEQIEGILNWEQASSKRILSAFRKFGNSSFGDKFEV